jgi:hypothetical protein
MIYPKVTGVVLGLGLLEFLNLHRIFKLFVIHWEMMDCFLLRP